MSNESRGLGENILLTGATGALGPALVAQLLTDNPCRHLRVLIRPGSGTVRDRFQQLLSSVERVLGRLPCEPSGWHERVSPLIGDVGAPQLGMSQSDAAACLADTDLIIHAAACTSFRATLDEHRRANVAGTRHVVDIARASRRGARLLLVSTVCTSGTRGGRIEESFSSTPPVFGNPYEQSKWEAEQTALQSDVPLGIARVGIVIGSHIDGHIHRPGAFHHLVRWCARGLVPAVPGSAETWVDLISTEVATQFIARAAEAPWEPEAIWHVAAGDRAARLHDLADVVWTESRGPGSLSRASAEGHPFIVDRTRFDAIRASYGSRGSRVTRQTLDAINLFMPGLTSPRIYDCSRAEMLWGGRLPYWDWRQVVRRHLSAAGLCRTVPVVA